MRFVALVGEAEHDDAAVGGEAASGEEAHVDEGVDEAADAGGVGGEDDGELGGGAFAALEAGAEEAVV